MLKWVDDTPLNISTEVPFLDRLTFQGLWEHSVEAPLSPEMEKVYHDQYTAVSFGAQLPKDVVAADPLLIFITNGVSLVKNHVKQELGIEPDYVEHQLLKYHDNFSLFFIPWYNEERFWVNNDDHRVFRFSLEGKLLYASLGDDPLVKYIIDAMTGKVDSQAISLLPQDVDYTMYNDNVLVRTDVSNKTYSDIVGEVKSLKRRNFFGLYFSSEEEVYAFVEVAQMFEFTIWNNCAINDTNFTDHKYIILQSRRSEFDKSFILSAAKETRYTLPTVKFGLEFAPLYTGELERLFILSLAYTATGLLNPVLRNYSDKLSLQGTFATAHFSASFELDSVRQWVKTFNAEIGIQRITSEDQGKFYQNLLAQKGIVSLVLPSDGPVLAYLLPSINLEDRVEKVTFWSNEDKEYIQAYNEWTTQGKPVKVWDEAVFPTLIPNFELDVLTKDKDKLRIWVKYTSHTLCPEYREDKGQTITVGVEEVSTLDQVALFMSNWLRGDIITDWCKSYLFYTGLSTFSVLK